jgi:NitT/TauT family transport system ATP-binding protein
MTPVTMAAFVDTLERIAADRLDPRQVQAYLQQTPVAPAALEPYLVFRPGGYTRNLVHRTSAFEVLVICWDVGQRAPVHGHEGEFCWARIERGRLRFTTYRVESEDPLVVTPTGPPVDAEPPYLDGPADIHAVENPVEFGMPAATLHVYARPYDACDVYDLALGVRKRVTLGYDTIDGQPVAPAP